MIGGFAIIMKCRFGKQYLKMGIEQKHWTKEVVQRTKKRDDTINSRFAQKKINHFMDNIAQSSPTISDLQIQLKHILVTIDDGSPCTGTCPSNCRTNITHDH